MDAWQIMVLAGTIMQVMMPVMANRIGIFHKATITVYGAGVIMFGAGVIGGGMYHV